LPRRPDEAMVAAFAGDPFARKWLLASPFDRNSEGFEI
jgi:hypothetical protein